MEINRGHSISVRSLFTFFFPHYLAVVLLSCCVRGRQEVRYCGLLQGRWGQVAAHLHQYETPPHGFPSRRRAPRFITWPGWVLMNILIIPVNGSTCWGVLAAAFLQVNMGEGGSRGEEKRGKGECWRPSRMLDGRLMHVLVGVDHIRTLVWTSCLVGSSRSCYNVLTIEIHLSLSATLETNK